MKNWNKILLGIVGSLIIITLFMETYPQQIKTKISFLDEVNESDILMHNPSQGDIYNPTYYYLNILDYSIGVDAFENVEIVFYNDSVNSIKTIEISINNIIIDKIEASELKKEDGGYLLDFTDYGYKDSILLVRIMHIVVCIILIIMWAIFTKLLKNVQNWWINIFFLIASYFMLFFKSQHIDFSSTFLIFTIVVIGGYVLYKKMNASPTEVLFFGILAEVALYYSVYDIGTFLTVDESRAILEQVNIENDMLRHFLYFGNARTNYCIMGTLWKLIPVEVANLEWNEQMYVAKLMHWFVGVVLICFVSYLVEVIVLMINKSIRATYVFASSFLIILVNPLVLLALKNYNYDLFSMLFGAIAILLSCICIKSGKISYGIFSVITGTLAAQEKMTAIPILIISMIILVGMITWKKEKRFLLTTLLCSFGSTLLVGSVMYLSIMYVSIVLRKGVFPSINLNDVYMPIIAVFSQMTDSIGNVKDNCGIIVFFSISCIVMGGVITVRLISSYINNENGNIVKNIWGKRKWIFVIGLTVSLLLGVLGTYFEPYVYMEGAYELKSNTYVSDSVTAMNFYFDTNSFVTNEFKFIVTMFEMLYNSMSTVCILLLIVLLFIYIRKTCDKCDDFVFEIFILIYGVGAMIAYGIINLTPLNRYINVYVLAEVLLIIILFWKNVDAIKNFRYYFTYGICVFAMIESLVFGPAYTSYWPIWNVMPYFEKENVQGRMLLNWQGGWGEHIAIAGEKIEEWCLKNNIPLEKVRIYTNYHGVWVTNENNIFIDRMPGYRSAVGNEYPEIRYEDFYLEEGSFYVFSKWGFRWASVNYGLPENIEPLMTISYRNAEECWIYTGEQLKEYFQTVVN